MRIEEKIDNLGIGKRLQTTIARNNNLGQWLRNLPEASQNKFIKEAMAEKDENDKKDKLQEKKWNLIRGQKRWESYESDNTDSSDDDL